MDWSHLTAVLHIEEKLRGLPHYANLRKVVNDELRGLDNEESSALGRKVPEAPVELEIDRPTMTPIYPQASGVEQSSTTEKSEVRSAIDRRA